MTETRVQSPSDTPVKFELMEADDYSRYLLHSRGEIEFLLRAIIKSADLITAYFNQGSDFVLTALLAIDDEGIVLDYGASTAMNRKALSAGKLILIATHDRVKIQFSVPWVKEVRHEGRPAFRAPMPAQILRLQRREYYRLTAPVARPLKCTLVLVLPGGERRTVEAQVVDISGGGIAVMAPPSGFEFAIDQEFESCALDLPDAGLIRARLKVRNVFEVVLRNGARVKRSGCQFMNLPGTMINKIERYIMNMERERKARGAGHT